MEYNRQKKSFQPYRSWTSIKARGVDKLVVLYKTPRAGFTREIEKALNELAQKQKTVT